MTERASKGEASRRATVEVHVEPDQVTRFTVGTRWEVVGSSLDSLWNGQHTVTLRPVGHGNDP